MAGLSHACIHEGRPTSFFIFFCVPLFLFKFFFEQVAFLKDTLFSAGGSWLVRETGKKSLDLFFNRVGRHHRFHS